MLARIHDLWFIIKPSRLAFPRIAHCNTLQHTATHCNTLQHTATHCNTLQHTATHCSTLQHTALSQPALSRLHYRVLECQWMTKRRIAWATWRWDNVWRCMSGTANAWMHMHVFTQGRIRLWILQMVCCPSLMTHSTSIVQCHSQHVTLIAHPVCCHP